MFFVLTGAGISAESGVMTFRGDGLWDGVPVTDVAYPDAFEKDPERVCLFYDRFREKVLAARPNPAHLALARLEEAFPGQVTVVSQNVDDLHERAGSRNVIHIHGSVLKGRCALCGEGRDVGAGFVATPPCPCGGKRDIVEFSARDDDPSLPVRRQGASGHRLVH